MTQQINPGDIVRVSTTPGFKDSTGALADPTTVTLRWRVGRGTETVWTRSAGGPDTQIVRDSTGLYHADIPVTLPGLHYFRWKGAGVVDAAEEATFSAESEFVGV